MIKVVQKMKAKQIRQSMVMTLAGLILSACANHNALLQSPVANTVQPVDQINDELTRELDAKNKPATIPANVMSALTPQLSVPQANTQTKRFDIVVNGIDAEIFFAGLVEGTPYNMVVHPDVRGKISLTLKDVTLQEVLEITKDIYGYDFEEKGRLIKVYPSGLQTRIFEINYLNVKRSGGSETRVSSGQITVNSGNNSSGSGSDSDSGNSRSSVGGLGTRINTSSESAFWDNLAKTLDLIVGRQEGRSVILTPSAGVAVVRADTGELEAVQRYLESAELIMKRQVILEAKILEVELSDGYQQGIDWSFSENKSPRGDGTFRHSIDLLQSARTLTSPDIGGVFASTITDHSFSTTIQLLGTQGNVQVLSSPRIATVNNQKAVIKVGSDEYYVTDIDFENDTANDSSSTDLDLTPFFSGIALDVTPQISEDGKIILHVHPTISEVEDQNKVINVGGQQIDLPLAFSTIRESDSVVTAENGQIVVIGGLIQNKSEDNNGSVPFFGDLPLIGELFKQKSNRSTKTELVILLKPTITNDRVFSNDIRASRDRFRGYREALSKPVETRFYE